MKKRGTKKTLAKGLAKGQGKGNSNPSNQDKIKAKFESNIGDYKGETREEFYQRILKGKDKEIDKFILALLSKEANLKEWLEKNDYDQDRFLRVLEEVYEKLLAVDYFNSRHLDFGPPEYNGPHYEKRKEIENLEYLISQFNQVIPVAKRGRKFIEGPKGKRNRKKPKQEAFHQWVKNFGIDKGTQLDDLVIEAEEAFKRGDLKIKIGRDTINTCLSDYRKKKPKA